MRHHRRTNACIGECSEVAAIRVRINANRMELRISTGVIGMETGVDDELNRLVADRTDCGDNFIRQPSRPGVHHHCAFVTDLDGDISAVAYQHVYIALDRQYMNLAVARIRVYCAAY